MSKQPCRYFFQPSGCRKGEACTFSHTNPASSSKETWRSGEDRVSGGNITPGRINIFSSSNNPPGQGAHPPGVCTSFWKTGECRFAFACRYNHQTPDNFADKPMTSTSGHGLSPGETHNRLRYFLKDDFKFDGRAAQAESFLALLGSAGRGGEWSREDEQLLFKELTSVNGNGIRRLHEIFKWQSISSTSFSFSNVLSFQRGYLKLLAYLASETVLQSTLDYLVNSLYSLLHNTAENFVHILTNCMSHMIDSKSFYFTLTENRPYSGIEIFKIISSVLYEYLIKFKDATTATPALQDLATNVKFWFEKWRDEILLEDTTFDDRDSLSVPIDNRRFAIRQLENDITRMVRLACRTRIVLPSEDDKKVSPLGGIDSAASKGALVALNNINLYEGPGELRQEGKRHDNDHIYIEDIGIIPSHQELICPIPPYLPANLYNAPHLHPRSSMERLLDIQFRLLREELIAPLRDAVQLVLADLTAKNPAKTVLSALIQSRGGRYRGVDNTAHSTLFNVYTGVKCTGLRFTKKGLVVPLRLDSPPGEARHTSANSRFAFWDGGKGKKRLLQGGLVAVVWSSSSRTHQVYLATIASSKNNIAESCKVDRDRISVDVSFFDPEVALRILRLLRTHTHSTDKIYLIESPLMFEAVRPFLEALQREPTTIPFARYLGHPENGTLKQMVINHPQYATVPGFAFNLKCLFDDRDDIPEVDYYLYVQSRSSAMSARTLLSSSSRLDPSQADAVVDSLCSEVALIQGPPGTGKSFTGIELIRVLLANQKGPILLIAFTNHALDHLLDAILNITQKIVRLGSRSTHEKIAAYSLENIDAARAKSRFNKDVANELKTLKRLENELEKLVRDASAIEPQIHEILDYLEFMWPEHSCSLENPPTWISALYQIAQLDSENGFQRVGPSPSRSSTGLTLFKFWRAGDDIEFLRNVTAHGEDLSSKQYVEIPVGEQRNRFAELEPDDVHSPSLEDTSPQHNIMSQWININDWPEPEEDLTAFMTNDITQKENITEEGASFFLQHGLTRPPVLPMSNRDITELLEQPLHAWSYSLSERSRLATFWIQEIQNSRNELEKGTFERLQREHEEVRARYNALNNESRIRLLKDMDVIGCTTTGAAKLSSLLRGVAPPILLVEEAGQVLEAHVLGSLVPSIQHLFLIGDPLQLRPNISNYALSTESKDGQLYKLDMSLMERLAASGLRMSILDVQRRMRPEISKLIRITLYPGLLDHSCVMDRPAVRGVQSSLFFLDHRHREDGSDELFSKRNTYEVSMIKDLVLYFLRQGCYSAPGDIVVLCAYLGQLVAVRDALSREVTTVIGEQELADLADKDIDVEPQDYPSVTQVKVTRQVLLRSLDSFQGEEAKLVILSTVRNSGNSVEMNGRPSIGFLKSVNRANVAVSRAREGLFVLGNADDLSHNDMWREMIAELRTQNAIGNSIGITCPRHPHDIRHISEPGQLPLLAPDGGCLRTCDTRLQCGHKCPHKCHPDDENHINVKCLQPCTRQCDLGHPCHKECWEDCEKCMFPMTKVQLSCGHEKANVPCYQSRNPDSFITCDVKIEVNLPRCTHTAFMPCGQDLTSFLCPLPCNGVLSCCGRTCAANCSACRVLDTPNLLNRNHRPHSCLKPLYCGHECGLPCAVNHLCATSCRKPCLQHCVHTQCSRTCSDTCSPCMELCPWTCIHHRCPSPCGSPCARIPCDKPCEQLLSCGHRCPSVCGEDCTKQLCVTCLPDSSSQRHEIVDFILWRTLNEVRTDGQTLDEMLITIPSCGHVFTVETLDGHCHLTEFYTQNEHGSCFGLKDPSNGFVKIPTCPTCRSPITNLRYGRIYKRARLDLLERNVASRASSDLTRARSLLDGMNNLSLPVLDYTLSRKMTSAQWDKLNKRYDQEIATHDRHPLPVKWLTPAPKIDKRSTLLLSFKESNQWQNWAHWANLREAYVLSYGIATKRPPHVQAWEAQRSQFYRDTLKDISKDPKKLPRNPEKYAMQFTNMHFGGPPPIADKRFTVEAFWLTLDIRFSLAVSAEKWLNGLKSTKSSEPHCKLWAAFIRLLYRSCIRDADVARSVAHEARSYRQVVRSLFFATKAQFERVRFESLMTSQNSLTLETRNALIHEVERFRNEAISAIEEGKQTYMHQRALEDEMEWLEMTLIAPTKGIFEEWQRLIDALSRDTFYTRVSEDDYLEVVKAFRPQFTHTGHFYQCPNGHIYVIADCGGANQIGRCPECGEAVGGTSHTLLEGNTRATELEGMLRQEGAAPSPWAWNRDA